MTAKKLAIDGLLLVDKPLGISSMTALAIVKRVLRCEKAGHTGTLDPLATGLLPICLGRATKLAQYLLASDKRYLATLRLGATTDTEDSDGKILEEKPLPDGLTRESFEKTLLSFQGPQMQIPPIYSALHVDGKRAYDLARSGQEVTLEARPIEIFSLSLASFEPPFATFLCHVSKGTYIRSLIRDIGKSLGCGAHMTALRRLSSGSLSLDEAISLDALQKDPSLASGAIVSLTQMLSHLPSLEISEAAAQRLSNGLITYELQAIPPLSSEAHRALAPDGRLVAVLQPTPEGAWSIVLVVAARD